MKVRGASFLPLLIAFPEAEGRLETWGRLLDLGALSARILTQTRLAVRGSLRLSFRLRGEEFDSLPAVVERVETDEDGYCRCEVRFAEERDRLRLGRVLRVLLASR